MIRPFPWDDLPVLPRSEVAFHNALHRWLDRRAAAGWPVVEKLVGGALAIRDVAAGVLGDSHCGTCAVRIAGVSIDVRGSNAAVRWLAQHLLGGLAELPAPRPLSVAERAIWALTVAAALEDAGVRGEVLACEGPPDVPGSREFVASVEIAGTPASVGIRVPRELELRVPPSRERHWPRTTMVDVPVVVGRCAMEPRWLDALAVRSVITLEPATGGAAIGEGLVGAELIALGGAVGISGVPGALVAEVATGYVPRAMALPDDAHVELTVGLGTMQMSLRQVFELAIGQVVPLGRPLAGPFEIRAAGKRVGYGELVDVDGELGVRILSLEE